MSKGAIVSTENETEEENAFADIHLKLQSEVPVQRWIATAAEKEPDAPAVYCAGRMISRGELETRANRLAHAFDAMGVGVGDVVAIALPNSVEFIEAIVATYKLGGTPMPLSYRLPRAERAGIVDLANAKLIIGVDAADHPNRLTVPAGYEPDSSVEATPILPDRTSPTASITTSGGSTGRPKLMVTPAPSTMNLTPMATAMGISPDGCMLIPGPLYHGSGFTFALMALATGCPVALLPKFEASAALEAIGRHKVDWTFMVPTMMSRMLRAIEAEPGRFDVSPLRMLMHGAAICPVWVKQGWIGLIGPEKVVEVYGASEAPIGVQIVGTEWLDHKGSVGKPLMGEIKIVDEDFNELPRGEVGEIFMKPPVGFPDKADVVGGDTRKRDGWTSVGDLGWVDADGYLYISDRRVDMIVSGGANVFPAEVEAALSEHPKVQTSIVVGLPDDDLGQRVHAIVQGTGDVTVEELLEFLGGRLVRYKIPRSIRLTDESLRDDADKARRSLIREQEIERLGLTL
jgi:bile acid-coenzyme A ligase